MRRHNGSIPSTVASITCPRCGGLLVADLAIDYKEGMKCDYWKCVQCSRPCQWGPLKDMYVPLNRNW